MISIIIPIYNEERNISELLRRIFEVIEGQHWQAEVIAINDASQDNSWRELSIVAAREGRLKLVNFSKNFGQTAALAAGFKMAKGDVVVTIDGDLENDPADIPSLVAALGDSYDVVSGWRKERWKNHFFTRKLPSVIANKLISSLSGIQLSDYGCTLKAYRRSVIENLHLYGDMHRFIAAYAYWHGARVTEIPVRYTPRVHGTSNYGIGRVWRVILDLISFKFLTDYATRPLHMFGSAGITSIILGLIAGAFSLFFKLSVVHHKDLIQTPLPVIMAMFVLLGVMFIMMGLLAEILMRTYHEVQDKEIYRIKETVNL